MTRVRVVGPGRAGCSLARALSKAGWDVLPVLRRGDGLGSAAAGVDLLVIATPDRSITSVSRQVRPQPSAVVAHMSGSLGLDALEPHPRRAAIHPLVPLPDPELGARRLQEGAYFAVAGDAIATRVVETLGGVAVEVLDGDRVAYHAAACIAANHLVALMGQVERLAAGSGVPLGAFVALARYALDDVAAVGPADALTGPVKRRDWETVDRHRRVLRRMLEVADLRAYEALVEVAALLGRQDAATPAGMPPQEAPTKEAPPEEALACR